MMLRADGYKYASEWWLGLQTCEHCIQRLTGCEASDDVACGDRHALQKLLVGPFRSRSSQLNTPKPMHLSNHNHNLSLYYRFTAEEEARIVGVPHHVKHGIMSLRHSLSPRFEVAVHLRTQFKYFEWLVGPTDSKWNEAQAELHDWLDSKDGDKGYAIFRAMESKLVEVLSAELKIRYGGETEVSQSPTPLSSSSAASSSPPSSAAKSDPNAPSAVVAATLLQPTPTPTPMPSPSVVPPSPSAEVKGMRSDSGGFTGSLWDMIWHDPASVKRRNSTKHFKPSTPLSGPAKVSEPADTPNIDYKQLYEATQKRIDELDYKKLYEETQVKIKALQMELGEAPRSSNDAALIHKVLKVRDKILGPGQTLIEAPSSSLAESAGNPKKIPGNNNNFEELNFSEQPYRISRLRRRLSDTDRTDHNEKDSNVLFVYVTSDNSVVKEAFCKYLEAKNFLFTLKSGNVTGVAWPKVMRLEIMRVINDGGYIAHGKNIKNLKETTNNTGVVDLALDWYATSLANHILSWRRDTQLISTFAQSAQRLSGNSESTNRNKEVDDGGHKNLNYHGIGHGRGSRGYNLYFGRNDPFAPRWREYW